MMYYHDGFIGGGLFGGLFELLFWALVIYGIVWIVRHHSRCTHHGACGHHSAQNSALEILRERYAKGEIQKEEFESKKKDLSE